MASQYVKLPSEAGSGPAAGVDSFNGRTGIVVSQAGDYAAGIVGNTPAGNIAATTVQDALNELDSEKQAIITGAATTITSADLTASRALQSDGSGKVAISSVTSTELGHLSGVTSAVQTQLDNRQPLDADLTALAGLVDTGLIARTGPGTVAAHTISSDASITVVNGDGVLGAPTLSLPTSGVTAGNYTLSNVTVNDRGIITNIASGTPTDVSPDLVLKIVDDFTGSASTTGSYGFSNSISGTGSSINTSNTAFQNPSDRAVGVCTINCGQTTNARATIATGLNNFAAGYAALDFQARVTLNDAGTTLDTFSCTFGFIDNTSAGVGHTDGIFFRFQGDGVNTNWECVTSAGGIETSTATSSAVLVNNFQIFQIVVNEAGTQAQFYIDGVLVATNVSNIPGLGRFFGMGLKMIKILATTTAEYDLYCDWVCATVSYSGPRG